MSISVSVRNMQTAVDQLRQELKAYAGGKSVMVGIHEGAPQPGSGELNMATLGAVLHFGSEDGRIPARPWLDAGIESGTTEILDIIRSGIGKGLSLDTVLEQVGVVSVGAVQEFMTDLKDPPNAPSTIEKKGSDNPLIDSGALRASITYSVTTTKPAEGIGG